MQKYFLSFFYLNQEKYKDIFIFLRERERERNKEIIGSNQSSSREK